MLFELVVSSTCTAEVAAAGLSALFPWDRVVQVGARGRLAADRVAAGEVAGDHVLAQPRRRPVGIGCRGVRAPADGGVGFGLDQGTLQRPFGGAQRSRDDPVRQPAARCRPDARGRSRNSARPHTSGRPHTARRPRTSGRPRTSLPQSGDRVLADRERDPAGWPGSGRRPIAVWRAPRGSPAGAAADPGDRDSVAVRASDDHSPLSRRVAGGCQRELTGLGRCDRSDPAKPSRPVSEPSQGDPGQRHIQQARGR